MNSITKILVRDTDKQADTAIALPLTGGTLAIPSLPKNWSLSVYFATPPIVSATEFGACFSVDGGTAVYQESPPYVVNNKHPGNPLNLQPGDHTVAAKVDGQAPQVVSFVVTATPVNPASPTDQIATTETVAGILGTNGEGMTDAKANPAKRPILPATMKALKMAAYRLWTTGQIGSPFPADMWLNSKAWASLGFKVISVINFQNTKGAHENSAAIPVDSDWIATLNSIPPATETGVWAFEIGGEIDFKMYWTGTPAQYAHLLAIAYHILKPKGYIVIAANCLNSLDYYKSLPADWQDDCDAIGRHFYQSTAKQCLAVIDELETYAATLGKAVVNTEGNIRNGDAAQTKIEIATLVKGLATKAGTHCLFPLVDIPTDPIDPNAPLTAAFVPSGTYAAYLPA